MTNACNIHCVMCGRNAADFKPTIFDIDWLKYFEPITDKIEEVTLLGWGEPTLHPHFSDFLKWADEKGLRKFFCIDTPPEILVFFRVPQFVKCMVFANME